MKIAWTSSSSANCVTSPVGEISLSTMASKSIVPMLIVLAVSTILLMKDVWLLAEAWPINIMDMVTNTRNIMVMVVITRVVIAAYL